MDIDEPYKLNTQRITQILEDHSFYRYCIAYFFMEKMATACCIAHMTEVAGRDKQDRETDKSRETIAPAIRTFVRHTAALHEEDPELLVPLRKYLESKLNYSPPSFVLSYSHEGGLKEICF